MEESVGIVFARKSSGLVKALTWWDVFVLVVSAPAGSGILYFSVSGLSSFPGGSVAVAFLIGMLLVFPVIWIAALTGALIPRSGSLYVLISRVLSPSLGFLSAALFYLGYAMSVGVVACVVTGVSGGILALAGKVARSGTLEAVGQALQEPRQMAAWAALLVVLAWALVSRGVRVFRKAMRVLFVGAVSSVLMTVVIFLRARATGGAEHLFDQVWGRGCYERILERARELGWAAQGFSWSATLDLLLVVLFAYGGLELVSYAGGEISQAESRAVRGYLAGWACLASVYLLIAFAVSWAFGDFLGAYDYLFRKHPEELKQIMPAIGPSVPFYLASVTRNPWLGVVVSLGLCLWLVNTMVPYFFAPSRLLFALAMDRSVPQALSNVSPKTGAPTTASHLTLAVALGGVFLNLLQVTVVLGTILFCALFVYWLYGLSAALLPFRRSDLYRRLPVQREVAGLPSVSLLGAVTTAVGWFVLFVAVRQLNMPIVILLSLMLAAVVLFYVWRLALNRRAGVDMERIYSQLPPE